MGEVGVSAVVMMMMELHIAWRCEVEEMVGLIDERVFPQLLSVLLRSSLSALALILRADRKILSHGVHVTVVRAHLLGHWASIHGLSIRKTLSDSNLSTAALARST